MPTRRVLGLTTSRGDGLGVAWNSKALEGVSLVVPPGRLIGPGVVGGGGRAVRWTSNEREGRGVTDRVAPLAFSDAQPACRSVRRTGPGAALCGAWCLSAGRCGEL
jgi:hypothetical protein